MSDKTTVNIKVTMRTRWVPYFLSMLKHMEFLGNIGSSREVAFYCDGDGAFRPKFEWDYEGEVDEEPVRNKNGDVMYDAG